jgi:hypothetical protein
MEVRSMPDSVDRIISDFGYRTIEIFFGINSDGLDEDVLRKLMRLVVLYETEHKVRRQVQELLDTVTEMDAQSKSKLLLSLFPRS